MLWTSGLQKWIGFVDVKSFPIYFCVERSTTVYNQTRTPIPFDVEKLNIGEAMNLQSGKFTAPRTGKYFFTFTGLARFPGNSSYEYLNCGIYKNGNSLYSRCYGDVVEHSTVSYETISLQSTLPLQAGDQIWLKIDSMSNRATLHGDLKTHFSGWLISED